MVRWQSGHATGCNPGDAGSIPVRTSTMEILILILTGFVFVRLMFPKRKRHMEPNPTYSKEFWRLQREREKNGLFYPGPPPM